MGAFSLASAVQDVLRQGQLLLEATSSESYKRREGGPHGASIGAHYRHVLDHFLCLLDGMESGQIDYDRRLRSPELENSVNAALRMTQNLTVKFCGLPPDMDRRECIVTYSVGYGGEAQSVRSNLAREVMFCIGHAIHHYAILKLLCTGMSVTLPCEFGIAPSTLKHLEAQAAH